MKTKTKISIFLVIALVGLLVPISQISAASSYYVYAAGRYTGPTAISVHQLKITLTPAYTSGGCQGAVKGYVDFTVEADNYVCQHVYVDKIYLFVDTVEDSYNVWSDTFSSTEYDVQYPQTSKRYQITTPYLNAKEINADYYSVTLWIRVRFVGIYGTFTGYLGYRPIFADFGGYYLAYVPTELIPGSSPPTCYIETSSSALANVYI